MKNPVLNFRGEKQLVLNERRKEKIKIKIIIKIIEKHNMLDF